MVAEALDNLAACASPPSMDLLVQGGMLPCLTMLLRGDALAVQATCATALANAAFAKDAIFAAFVEGGDNSPLTDFSNALRRHIFEPDPEMDPSSPEYLGADVVGACDAALVGGVVRHWRHYHMIRQQGPKCKRPALSELSSRSPRPVPSRLLLGTRATSSRRGARRRYVTCLIRRGRRATPTVGRGRHRCCVGAAVRKLLRGHAE